ncbi:tubulin-tyrosine ligase family-domain-containing protein, partial [Tribonema minus]
SQLSLPDARDFNDWKRRNGLRSDAKVFIMTGWFPCVKNALQQRGWHNNPDRTSPFFDLRWALHSSDRSAAALQPWQLSNHFVRSVGLTTKAGLLDTMRSLRWHVNADGDSVFPRCYNLSVDTDALAFMEDFKVTAATNVLKHVLRQWSPEGAHFMVNGTILEAALAVCMRRVRRASSCGESCSGRTGGSENADMDTPEGEEPLVSAVEWELLCLATHTTTNHPDPDFTGLYPLSKARDSATAAPVTSHEFYEARRRQQAEARRADVRSAAARSKAAEAVWQDVSVLGSGRLQRVRTALAALRRVHAQFDLDGTFGQNIWIIKPAAKSRGRGISCFADLGKLLECTETLHKGGGTGLDQWVVQKYIENPLLISRRKFDIRQWVLVTDWNPLTVYFCDKCYLRFGVEDYTTSTSALSNAYVHLVNNSIGKTSDNWTRVTCADNGEEVREHMWRDTTFAQYLADTGRPGAYNDIIKPRMQEIVTWAIMCGRDNVEARKNSWELYGFDFMFDDSLQPWLIEINSSPACDYSTSITQEFVQEALVDVLKVVLDMRAWEESRGNAASRPDTGLWKLLHKGPYLPMPASAFGADMTLKGTRIVKGAHKPSS